MKNMVKISCTFPASRSITIEYLWKKCRMIHPICHVRKRWRLLILSNIVSLFCSDVEVIADLAQNAIFFSLMKFVPLHAPDTSGCYNSSFCFLFFWRIRVSPPPLFPSCFASLCAKFFSFESKWKFWGLSSPFDDVWYTASSLANSKEARDGERAGEMERVRRETTSLHGNVREIPVCELIYSLSSLAFCTGYFCSRLSFFTHLYQCSLV